MFLGWTQAVHTLRRSPAGTAMGALPQQPTGRPQQGTSPGSASAWGEGHGHDPVNSYFECITACSVDDGECVTRCVEVLREGD